MMSDLQHIVSNDIPCLAHQEPVFILEDKNGGQFQGAAKLRILLSNIKQTTNQNAYILYESLAGNQRNPLSKFFWQAILSAKQLYEIGPR